MKNGYLFIALSASLWGLFPVLTSRSGTSIDPLWNAALSTLISTIPFALLMSVRKKWFELRNRQAVRYALSSATLIGVLYYGVVFIGSSMTSPQNTAILLLLELFTSFILLAPIRDERLSMKELGGGALLLCSALLVSGGGLSEFSTGDWLVIGASILTPFGNLYTKKARMLVSSETVLFLRSMWSGAFLAGAAIFAGSGLRMTAPAHDLAALAVTGVFLMGISKMFWTEGIVSLKIGNALAVHSAVAPCVTFVAAFLLFGQLPELRQLLALPVGLAGVAVLLGR